MASLLRSAVNRVLSFEGTVTFAMRLPLETSAGDDENVREVLRSELVDVFRSSGLYPGAVENHDALYPGGWRCFATFDKGTPVHHTFVSYRPMGPVLYRVATDLSYRRQGLFRRTVDVVASRLALDGEDVLYSKAGLTNTVSVAAHRAIGFEVIKTRRNVAVFGWAPRPTLSRTIRRLARIRLAGK